MACLKFPKPVLLAVAGVMVTGAAGYAQDREAVAFGEGMASGFPESVTSTDDGTLISGSFTGGLIHRAEPGASAAEVWIEAPADGPGSVIGVFADNANNTLWACYSDPASFGGAGVPAQVRSFALDTGEQKGSYDFPEGSFCNDIATLADGTAFATDTAGGRIMRVAPDADEAELWFSDPQLAGLDGISFGPDGALYLNTVTTNKLFRLEVAEGGEAGSLTELTPSQPLSGADGMRFGPDGTLYLAENGAGRVVALTIEGDNANVEVIADGYQGPTAVTLVDDVLWIAEAKLDMMGGDTDPGIFYVHPVALGDVEANGAESSAN